MGLLFVSYGLFVAGCGDVRSAAKDEPKVPEVGVITVVAQPVTLSTELAGRTSAFMVAQIRPQVGGILNQRVFTEGAVVKAGELLYRIDPASYQAAYASAQAGVARAEATLDAARLKAQRQSGLLAIEAISTQDLEDAQVTRQQAQADLASAQAALESARINLEHTRISSPIAGRVETSSVTPGALVTANQETALTTVQQLDPIYVDIPQSSAEVLQLKQTLASGKLESANASGPNGEVRIELQLEDGSTYKHQGRLQFSGVTVNSTTGAVTLRALLPNPEHLLMPGMYVRATLEKGTDPQALLVPQPGIGRDNAGRATALVVSSAGLVELRKVSVAEVVGNSWRVTQGLQAGERVIVEGSSKVRPGQTVRAVAATPNAPTTRAVPTAPAKPAGPDGLAAASPTAVAAAK